MLGTLTALTPRFLPKPHWLPPASRTARDMLADALVDYGLLRHQLEANAVIDHDKAAAGEVMPCSGACDQARAQQRLYFLPEPQGHGSLRPILVRCARTADPGRLAASRMRASLRKMRIMRGIRAAS